MTKHILTKSYSILRGFSTDSKFVRPSNVADKAVNMMRLPDGTFAPRRGYQVQEDDIGGLGNAVYENQDRQTVEPICIHRDGNLYLEKTGTLTITFNDPLSNPESYFSYEIYVDPANVSDTNSCDFDPYQIVDDNALIDDSINFKSNLLRGFTGVSVGSGSATYTSVLAGFPITPGSIFMTDGTYTIQDDGAGSFVGDIGVGTNTIDYTTGAYTVTFVAVTGTTTASYKTTLQEQFNIAAGKGYNTASPPLISSLITQLNGVTGITTASTGSTNYPIAFIEVSEETNIADGQSVTISWKYWESANRTVASTFSGLVAKINSDDFRNATFAPYEEAVYIASRYDEVQKYDGQTIYRAGMPQGATPSLGAVDTGSGTVTNGAHNYSITYEQVDNNGRIVEGVIGADASITTAGSQNVNVTVANLVQGSGWNTNCAIVNGAQTTVNTIIVDDGSLGPHSLQVGDSAYFFDSVTNGYVTRNITAVTSSSITIDGNAVTVSDNDPISNNLKINIWNTEAGGTAKYLVRSLSNNSYSATQTFKDTTPDSTLNGNLEYATPVRLPQPPPKVGVVVAYGNQIIYTDDPENDDYVWFSEASQPEYVPQAENNFIVPSNDDDVTGAGVSGSTLVIFKQKSIFAVSGDLINDQFTVTSVAPGSNIGCVSQHTIVSVGGLLYFLHTNGLYAIAENQLYPTDSFGNPVPLTIMIDEIFRQDNSIQNQRFILKRATAVNYTKDNQYLLFLPSEEQSGPRAANENSRILCYDYQGKNWFEWTRINAAGGFYVLDDNLYWQERAKKNNLITAKKYKQHRKYRLIDYVDHVTPTRVTWESSWEDVGQPRVRKKFVRSILLFDEISAIYQQNIPTLCFYSYKDWVEGRASTRADVMQKINSSNWSTTQFWNWISWSGYQDSFITIPLKGGTVTKSLKIGMQLNQINTTFRLQGFQHEISPDFRKTVVR